MGKVDHPQWDKQYLEKIGFQVTYEKSVIDELWGEDEKLIYGATPMFMIVAEKPLSSSGYLLDNIQKYWDMRSETYSIQNREELMTEQNKWIDKILPRLPQKEYAYIRYRLRSRIFFYYDGAARISSDRYRLL